jgi:hypothetical protein
VALVGTRDGNVPACLEIQGQVGFTVSQPNFPMTLCLTISLSNTNHGSF